MGNRPAAALKDVILRYRETTVLDRLSLSVETGEVFGILGCIGTGKTRILRLLAGLEKPDSGTIHFSPELQGLPVSYIFQHDLLVPWLTVGENLRLCKRHPRDANGKISELPIYKQLGLDLIEDKKPYQLSGGMRKKVNFARAFINDDRFILMDEPFGALDPAQKRDIQQGFLSLTQKVRMTAVLVTHDIREALLVCDRIAFLSGKTKRLNESMVNPFRGRFDVNELFSEPRYREIFQAALDFYDDERRRT